MSLRKETTSREKIATLGLYSTALITSLSAEETHSRAFTIVFISFILSLISSLDAIPHPERQRKRGRGAQ
jgi:hypothetical protein